MALAPTADLLPEVEEHSEAWHELRRTGIGGSDVASVLGVSPYPSGPLHVWQAKRGEADPPVPTERMRMGSRMEQVICRMWSEDTGLDVIVKPGTFRNRMYPWAIANPDALVFDGDPNSPESAIGGPLEVKNVASYSEADWERSVPDYAALQVQWYLAVGGWSHGYAAALCGGQRLLWHVIQADEELIGYMLAYVGDWWRQHIIEGKVPDADGNPATTELLSRMWEAKPAAIREVPPVQAKLLLARRRELRAAHAEVGRDLAAIENNLRALLGEDEIATVEGRTAYTWRANGTFQASRFREENPELAAQYTKLSLTVDTDKLKTEHPDVYRQYRARVLRIPEEES